MLKVMCPYIKNPLSVICNKSITEGVFPKNMKIAKLIPLYKAGDRANPDNYRPISLLPVMSKILESVVHEQLQNFMTSNTHYCKTQFGFRKKSSTINACQRFMSDVLHAVDSDSYVLSVFIDLRKAFDTLSRPVLVNKLHKYNLDELCLQWIDDYLKDRLMYTSVDNVKSFVKICNMGIPQGSILGPEIFLYRINDLQKSLRYSQCILFADDTTIYLIEKNVKFMNIKMQSDLDKLKEWLDSNKLCLNIAKTKCMLLGVKPYNHDIDLKIDNCKIELVNEFKFLGIWFNNQVTFDSHAEKLINKLHYHLYIMKNTVKFLNDVSKKIFFHAFVMSIVCYGLIVWWPHLRQDNREKINTLVCRCKVLANIHNDSLKADTYFKIDMVKMYFDYHADLLPLGLREIFKQSTHSYSTRNKSTPQITKHKSKKYNDSFLVKSNLEWSKLPQSIKNQTQKDQFNKKLREYYGV